tara:strand:- start:206 stop:1246 length:1041 start_codon:yes stop_codon:yes gene_type:complete
MKYILLAFSLLLSVSCSGQFLKKAFRFSTFYASVNGNNSLSDFQTYSVFGGPLSTEVIETPFDYSLTLGVRKIARFGYEARANVFYDGTEKSYSDAATIGVVKGFEFLFEGDYRRQQGVNYLDQNHFLRYVGKNFITKIEFVQDGFADVSYYEASQRLRVNLGKKLSINAGGAQRISEAYGYNPLEEFVLGENNNIHYTSLALSQGYTIDPSAGEYYNPNGDLVASSAAVWSEVVIPQVLSDYVSKKRSELPTQWNYSLVAGFDFYHYSKEFWVHSWGSVMPRHLDTKSEFSYFKFNEGQWTDYSGGLIFGWKINKHLGWFLEGKYNKYWNRRWHDFSVGANYVIF